jgi:hypothetical protein
VRNIYACGNTNEAAQCRKSRRGEGMAYTASRLISIAEAEIGYREKASNAQLDSKNANSGSKNYQKYGRDLNKAGYYNGNKNGYEWCDQFVDWCFLQALRQQGQG